MPLTRAVFYDIQRLLKALLVPGTTVGNGGAEGAGNRMAGSGPPVCGFVVVSSAIRGKINGLTLDGKPDSH